MSDINQLVNVNFLLFFENGNDDNEANQSTDDEESIKGSFQKTAGAIKRKIESFYSQKRKRLHIGGNL